MWGTPTAYYQLTISLDLMVLAVQTREKKLSPPYQGKLVRTKTFDLQLFKAKIKLGKKTEQYLLS